MVRAVLDTNVLISGVFWKGAPFEILRAWQNGRFDLAISRPVLDEYRRVLEEMTKKRPNLIFTSILDIIELHSVIVEPIAFARTVCSDPDDDKFLEAAVAADALYVVSGDSALLKLKRHRGIDT